MTDARPLSCLFSGFDEFCKLSFVNKSPPAEISNRQAVDYKTKLNIFLCLLGIVFGVLREFSNQSKDAYNGLASCCNLNSEGGSNFGDLNSASSKLQNGPVTKQMFGNY